MTETRHACAEPADASRPEWAGVSFLLERFAAHAADDAIVWRDGTFSYGALLERVNRWRERLAAARLPAGSVVALESDFSPEAVAAFLALADANHILVPVSPAAGAQREEFLRTSQAEALVTPGNGADAALTPLRTARAGHALYQRLRETGRPGLVLFSSGSTGASKAAVHDLAGLLLRFRTPRRRLRTIAFLLFDHIGGLNTMLYTLAAGGCLITVAERDPDHVLARVARFRAELLPTSPTFLNLMLLSEAYARHRLDSLKLISYGTEPMPEGTLRRLHALLPGVRMQQTYGLSETGILPVKSAGSDSTWVTLTGDGYRFRVVDGTLHIRSDTPMLGYLNAPSPFTEDGWLATGDAVETDGERLRILGRKSELINVGGEKVYPAEVEDTILSCPNVADAVVYGEKNPITGAIVCARVRLREPEEKAAFVKRLREFCGGRLQRHKVPVRVTLTDEPLHGARFKKQRR